MPSHGKTLLLHGLRLHKAEILLQSVIAGITEGDLMMIDIIG